MNKSKIEWTNYTWNPVTGCFHNCSYCYARKIAERFGLAFAPILGDVGMEGACKYDSPEGMDTMLELEKPYRKNGNIQSFPMAFLPTFHRYRLDEPQKLKNPSTIFVCSMADLFGEWVPDEWIDAVFKACEGAPQHRYLFLTKNPKRCREALPLWKSYYGKLTNMWFGATVTGDDDRQKAWDLLTSTNKGINKFLSIEPLISGFNLNEHELLLKGYREKATIGNYIDWIIVGAETGNRKDKVIPERKWIESIVNQCKDAEVPLFMKNSLKDIWGESLIQEFPWEE